MRQSAKALCDINGTVGVHSSRLPVRSIIFLGAPHKGLHTTALETLVKSKPTEDMVRELKAGSFTLTELNDKFRFAAKDIDIVTLYELNMSKLQESQLKKAMKKGDIEVTKDLIARLFDVNCKDEDGRTPLHDAAYYRSEPLVKLLLELGADRRAKANRGHTTLHFITHPDTVWTQLKESLIDLLLQHSPPLDEPAQDGMTALMGAASVGEHLLAMKLISRGASTRLTDKEGCTALHYATHSPEAPEMITLLITDGAVVDTKSFRDWTPLHVATKTGNVHAVKTLLAHGANPFAKLRTFPPGGMKPRTMLREGDATKEQEKEIRKMLKEAENEWKRSGKKYSKFSWLT
ncbi:MAG: hypothetical protein Q9173_000256 [Seirophora scorigena]